MIEVTYIDIDDKVLSSQLINTTEVFIDYDEKYFIISDERIYLNGQSLYNYVGDKVALVRIKVFELNLEYILSK